MFASQAQGAVYWAHGHAIGAANLDGSAKISSYLTNESWKLADPSQPHQIHGSICGIAVDATHLYWSEYGVITRFALDGRSPIQRLVGGSPGTCGVAIDRFHIYWPSGGGSVGRANLDGSAANLNFVTGGQGLCAVAVDGSHVYWVDRGDFSIGRARLDGSDVEHRFLESPSLGCGLAVDGGHVYWAGEPGSIGRASLDGNEVEPHFITGAGGVSGIAVYGPHIYWTDRGDAHGTVGGANLDGSGVNREFVVVDGPGVFGVAVDSRVVSLPPQPSANVRFRKLRHDRRRGVAYLSVEVPSHGALRIRSAGLHGRFVNDRRASSAAGPFSLRLKLWPRGKGRVGHRIRRQLQRRGRAPAMLRLTYQEDGALPVTRLKRISLLRRSGTGSRARR